MILKAGTFRKLDLSNDSDKALLQAELDKQNAVKDNPKVETPQVKEKLTIPREKLAELNNNLLQESLKNHGQHLSPEVRAFLERQSNR